MCIKEIFKLSMPLKFDIPPSGYETLVLKNLMCVPAHFSLTRISISKFILDLILYFFMILSVILAGYALKPIIASVISFDSVSTCTKKLVIFLPITLALGADASYSGAPEITDSVFSFTRFMI